MGIFFSTFLGPNVDLCPRCWASFDVVLSHWDHQSTNNDMEIIINYKSLTLAKVCFQLALVVLLAHTFSSTFCHMTGYLISVLHIRLHLASNSPPFFFPLSTRKSYLYLHLAIGHSTFYYTNHCSTSSHGVQISHSRVGTP